MELVLGPECPGCGCPDSDLVLRRNGSLTPFERRRCNHCGRNFGVQDPDSIVYQQPVKPVCPECGARSKVTSAPAGRIRYHQCLRCRHNFKSVEVE